MKVWSSELEDLEQKFILCEAAAQHSVPEPPKKRSKKRKLEGELNQDENLEMAKLAASLQIAHFYKVQPQLITLN